MQRLYEWRATFGNTTIDAYGTYFEKRKNLYPEAEDRARHARKLLKNNRVFYRDPDTTSTEACIQFRITYIDVLTMSYRVSTSRSSSVRRSRST